MVSNGKIGIQLYNYLISILPKGTRITLPTTEYKIGDIIVNGFGMVEEVSVSPYNKHIFMTSVSMSREGLTPSLSPNGYFA